MNTRLDLLAAENAVAIGAITVSEIPDALEFFNIRQRLANSAEAATVQYLLDAEIELEPAQALLKNFDRYGLGAIQDNAPEVIELYSVVTVDEIYQALKRDMRYYNIANILYFAIENYWSGRAEESAELNFIATE